MELQEQMEEFGFYRNMILNNQTDGRNVIVEYEDGQQGVMTAYHCKNINDIFLKRKPIERLTIFDGNKEIEFVRCQ